MKRYLLLGLTIATAILYAAPTVMVTIPPQKEIVRNVAGESVDIVVMVPPGSSPHTYAPKPSQMRAVAHARLYLGIGVAFETHWKERFLQLNPKLRFVDTSRNVPLRTMRAKAEHDKDHETHKHAHDAYDPHIWTSPKNLLIIAQNVYEALSDIDPKHRGFFKNNLRMYTAKIRRLDQEIEKVLTPLRERHAAVLAVHPSWGYFCDRYGLTQIPLEIEGKSITPKRLMRLIETAKKEHIAAILAQPEFSDKAATLLSETLHLPIVRVSPLAAEWSQTLKRLAEALAKGSD